MVRLGTAPAANSVESSNCSSKTIRKFRKPAYIHSLGKQADVGINDHRRLFDRFIVCTLMQELGDQGSRPSYRNPLGRRNVERTGPPFFQHTRKNLTPHHR